MSQEPRAVVAPTRFHHRVRHGMRHPHNWFQLARYVAVGTSGYVVNLVVFALAVHPLNVSYRLAAVLAFFFSVLNNFWWNRHWTFGARDGRAGFQAARFFLVSGAAFVLSYAVLMVLVEGLSMEKVPAQALSIIAATPLSFLGQKLWSFRR